MIVAVANKTQPPWVGIADMRAADPVELPLLSNRLGPHDSQRYAAFGSERRRREFLIGRWLLHRASIAWLGAAAEVSFDSSPSGALCVTTPNDYPSIAASLSHAGDWFACALTFNGALGIDIEPITQRDFESMDEMAFADAGYPPLSQFPIDLRPQEFYKRWTRHEARFKITQAEHPALPVTAHTCIIHDSLMLSLCIADAGSDPIPPTIMEWMRDAEFGVCEAVTYQ